jgi:hypothetical protein
MGWLVACKITAIKAVQNLIHVDDGERAVSLGAEIRQGSKKQEQERFFECCGHPGCRVDGYYEALWQLHRE